MTMRIGWALCVAGALSAAAPAAAAAVPQDYRTVTGSRQRRGESDMRAVVEFAVGELHIGPGAGGALYQYNLVYDAEHFDPVTSYNPDARRLRIGVDGQGHGDLHYRHQHTEQRLDLSLSPATPLSLELSFGAGTGDVELGGLQLTNVAVKGGASEATIRVSQPNKADCRSFTLEVGAIDLKTEKLGNARCQHLELKGAAGDVTLDLTGQWPEGSTSQVDVSVGLGSVTLRLPEGVGVEADVERFLVNFDRSGLLRRGSSYYSANWDTAKTRIELNLKAALGDIQIEWAK
jgi:hypothetical protein